MRWILHRGNIAGPGSCENNPTGIQNALNQGYDVEIDLWIQGTEYWLGHDGPEYLVDSSFISKKGMWIHCKDAITLEQMSLLHPNLRFFYHTDEDYVLTSKGDIWCYIGKPPLKRSIVVMPERVPNLYSLSDLNDLECGVCSDYIKNYDLSYFR